jgi:deoxyhypusine synthase
MYSEWLTEQIGEMHDDQIKNKIIYSPSKIIQYLGRKIDNKDSICYWAYKNSIPIFSPAFTDGLLGDVLYVYGKERPGFIVDLTQDIRGMNREPLTSKKTGCIVLGGGLIKHHILNANLMRNGTDFAVFVNTGQEFDGSDAGAKPQEALSWGKLRQDCDFVKISAEATMAFPFLVSQSFAKNQAKASKL